MWNVSFSRTCYSPFLAIFSYDWSHTIFPSFCVSSFTSLFHWRIWNFRQKLEGWVHMWTFRMKRKTERNSASVCCRHFTAISVGCHSLCLSSTTSPSTDPFQRLSCSLFSSMTVQCFKNKCWLSFVRKHFCQSKRFVNIPSGVALLLWWCWGMRTYFNY